MSNVFRDPNAPNPAFQRIVSVREFYDLWGDLDDGAWFTRHQAHLSHAIGFTLFLQPLRDYLALWVCCECGISDRAFAQPRCPNPECRRLMRKAEG